MFIYWNYFKSYSSLKFWFKNILSLWSWDLIAIYFSIWRHLDFDALPLQRGADHTVFDDKNCILLTNRGLWTNSKWMNCLIMELLMIFCTYTISKILCEVIIAHFRSWRYIDVAYKSQRCKNTHLKDRDRFINKYSRSTCVPKKWCRIYSEKLFFYLLLKCSWLLQKSELGLINMI